MLYNWFHNFSFRPRDELLSAFTTDPAASHALLKARRDQEREKGQSYIIFPIYSLHEAGCILGPFSLLHLKLQKKKS